MCARRRVRQSRQFTIFAVATIVVETNIYSPASYTGKWSPAPSPKEIEYEHSSCRPRHLHNNLVHRPRALNRRVQSEAHDDLEREGQFFGPLGRADRARDRLEPV